MSCGYWMSKLKRSQTSAPISARDICDVPRHSAGHVPVPSLKRGRGPVIVPRLQGVRGKSRADGSGRAPGAAAGRGSSGHSQQPRATPPRRRRQHGYRRLHARRELGSAGVEKRYAKFACEIPDIRVHAWRNGRRVGGEWRHRACLARICNHARMRGTTFFLLPVHAVDCQIEGITPMSATVPPPIAIPSSASGTNTHVADDCDTPPPIRTTSTVRNQALDFSAPVFCVRRRLFLAQREFEPSILRV